MLAQTYMSSRSLTQGLDVINMEPSTPGVRTSVINSYLSNSANQNAASISNPNGLMASLEMDNTSVQGNSGTNPLSAAQNINSQALAQAHNQELTIVSPKIYSAIKNSIVQALNDQVASSQPAGAMSNVNALLSNQTVPGSMVDAAGAQINSFVNSLIFTVQSQTNLSPQEDLVPPSQPQPSSGFTLTSSQSAPVSGAWGGGINPSIAGLDSLLQSANSLFATMGLTSTVTASTLRTALEDIQRNLMSAPAQGQWINVVA